MTFGEKLLQARKAKKLTQRQLADMIDAKHNSVSDWENNKNKPDPDTIELLCGVLDISPNYLLANTSDDFSPTEKLIIKKYRKLNTHGKEMVDIVLEKEFENSTKIKESVEADGTCSITKESLYTLNAAHERTDIYSSAEDYKHDDDIMDDEEF